MKKIKLIFSLLLIATLLISPINVLAVIGEDNGTPSVNISSTPNAESNYIYHSWNIGIK
jgi:predicted small secreted protein